MRIKNERLIALRMPELLVDSLDQVARYEDMNRSSLIRKMSKLYLQAFKKREGYYQNQKEVFSV